jgi:hypothetical protein
MRQLLSSMLAAFCVASAFMACEEEPAPDEDDDGAGGQGAGVPMGGSGGADGGLGGAAPVCGDAVCAEGESCAECEADCGKCVGWCATMAGCDPWDPEDCGEGLNCDVQYTGDLYGDELRCWYIDLEENAHQQLGDPCDNISFGAVGFCAPGLICRDPTPGADDDVYDATCRKACCDASDCGGSACLPVNLVGAEGIGYCQ